MAIHDLDNPGTHINSGTPAMSSTKVTDIVNENAHTKGNYFGIFNKQQVEHEENSKEEVFTVKHKDLINVVYKYVAADFKVDYPTIRDFTNKSFTFSKTVTYYNLSKNHILYVQDSNNCVMPVLPVTNLYEYSTNGCPPMEHIVISEEYKFGNSKAAEHALDMIIKSLNNRKGLSVSPELIQMRDNLRAAIMSHNSDTNYNKTQTVKLYVTRRVTMTELRAYGRLYIPNMNVILSLDSDIYKIAHPTSVEGSREKARKGDLRDTSMPEFNESFELHMDLIDNDSKISSRWVNVLGKLVRIDPKKDAMRASGLYVSRSLGGMDIPDCKKFYTLDELKELNLYSTEEDALTHGDPSLIAEKLKHSKSVNEAYHAKVTSETKIQQEVNKSEAEIAKMKYDTINNIVKVVGAVVSFAVICATAIAKINSSKS